MKASEARRLANSENVVAELRTFLFGRIQAAAMSGKEYVFVPSVRFKLAVRALDSLGYKLQSHNSGVIVECDA